MSELIELLKRNDSINCYGWNNVEAPDVWLETKEV